MQHEIKSVTFDMTENDILNNSACLIDSSKRHGYGTVYDPRMGSLGATDICETCSRAALECPGYFGHIELTEPIFHPLFVSKLPGLLKEICFNCKTSCRTTVCQNCKLKQPTYKVDTYELTRDGVRMSPREFVTAYPNFERFVMKTLPVFPHCSRPSIQINDVVGDDDLTIHYIEIVKLNKKIPVNVKKLSTGIGALMDNSKGKIIHTTNLRPLKGIKERLCGKSGLVRNNIMGKRVNHAGRTVIGSNPVLALDELEVPEVMAKTLTLPERRNVRILIKEN